MAPALLYPEAARLDAENPGTAHLLIGLLAEAEGIAGQVLAHHGIDIDQVRAAADKQSNADAFDQAIQRAEQEAHTLSHTYVGTEHLLLALLHEDDLASQVLAELGIRDAQVRPVLQRMFAEIQGG